MESILERGLFGPNPPTAFFAREDLRVKESTHEKKELCMSFAGVKKTSKFTVCSCNSMKNLTPKPPVEKCPLESLTYKAFRAAGLRNPGASQED